MKGKDKPNDGDNDADDFGQNGINHFPRPWVPLAHGELVSKEMALYQKGSPFNRCGNCEYRNGQRCEIVAGYIAPYMVCKYFQKEWSNEDRAGVLVTVSRGKRR
jgi:hypothetical protein